MLTMAQDRDRDRKFWDGTRDLEHTVSHCVSPIYCMSLSTFPCTVNKQHSIQYTSPEMGLCYETDSDSETQSHDAKRSLM